MYTKHILQSLLLTTLQLLGGLLSVPAAQAYTVASESYSYTLIDTQVTANAGTTHTKFSYRHSLKTPEQTYSFTTSSTWVLPTSTTTTLPYWITNNTKQSAISTSYLDTLKHLITNLQSYVDAIK